MVSQLAQCCEIPGSAIRRQIQDNYIRLRIFSDPQTIFFAESAKNRIATSQRLAEHCPLLPALSHHQCREDATLFIFGCRNCVHLRRILLGAEVFVSHDFHAIFCGKNCHNECKGFPLQKSGKNNCGRLFVCDPAGCQVRKVRPGGRSGRFFCLPPADGGLQQVSCV